MERGRGVSCPALGGVTRLRPRARAAAADAQRGTRTPLCTRTQPRPGRSGELRRYGGGRGRRPLRTALLPQPHCQHCYCRRSSNQSRAACPPRAEERRSDRHRHCAERIQPRCARCATNSGRHNLQISAGASIAPSRADPLHRRRAAADRTPPHWDRRAMPRTH